MSTKLVVGSLEPVAGDDVGVENRGLPFGCANRIVCLAGSKTPGCGVVGFEPKGEEVVAGNLNGDCGFGTKIEGVVVAED